jgi:hypothetical protein
MRLTTSVITAGMLLALLLPCPALPCSLCGSLRREPLTQEYERASAVVYGRLANPKLDSNLTGTGTTELHIEKVIRGEPALAGAKVIALSRYLPVLDAKEPPRWLIFLNPHQGKLEATGGRPLQAPALLDYLQGLDKLSSDDRQGRLLYAARHFDAADSALAEEAFLEFARADDREVAEAARRLEPERLRRLLRQPDLEPERLSLFAYLLGACGGPADADFLLALIQQPDERGARPLEGLLAGLIALRPSEGWRLTFALLGDDQALLLRRFGAVRTLRFCHNSRPAETRAQVLHGLSLIIPRGELADMAINDLRSWQIWDLTPLVLAQYTKPSHDSPIVKNSIVRYALACPRPEARGFVEQVRRTEPRLVRELEEDLALEKSIQTP